MLNKRKKIPKSGTIDGEKDYKQRERGGVPTRALKGTRGYLTVFFT